ncbi:unnamed protein product [Lathyrus sativus]|nr:unnamed protein product [Lathyrus sativus]
MASFWSFSAVFIALMISCSCSLASAKDMHVSVISAAPSVLPEAPTFSPTLSPDMEPLFPSPGRAAFSPSDSSLPTIPSSPSPPNPDISTHQGPGSVFPPSESESTSPALAPSSQGAPLPILSFSHLAVILICIIQLHGM